MRKKLLLTSLIILLIIVLIFIGLLLRTKAVLNGSLQKEFIRGTTPSNLDGFYKGTAVVTGPWIGKSFDKKTNSGINILLTRGNKRQVFPFKTYIGKGIQDEKDVLKIDYNLPQNPFFVRNVVDELIEVAPNKYLGKAQVRFFNITFTPMFFRLEK